VILFLGLVILLVGWVVLLVGWLPGCWLVGWLPGWLILWFVGCLVGWLYGWLVIMPLRILLADHIQVLGISIHSDKLPQCFRMASSLGQYLAVLVYTL
jgi:hypothetical protein